MPEEVGGQKETLLKRAEGKKSRTILLGIGKRDSPLVYHKTSREGRLEPKVQATKPMNVCHNGTVTAYMSDNVQGQW